VTRRRRLSGSTLAALLLLVLAAGAVTYEVLRQRPAEADPVASPPPARPDETARLEGGFSWRATEEGQALFDLEASTLVGIDAGIHLIESVENLRIYMEDGRAVRLTARRGRIDPGEDRRRPSSPRVILEQDVRVRDPEGLVLTTDRLVYDAGERAMWAEGPARVEGATLQGTFGSLVYRPDARLMQASGAVSMRLGETGAWRVESGALAYRLETGEILFEEPMRARQQQLGLVAGTATVSSGDAPGAETTFHGENPVMVSRGGPGDGWQLSAARLTARGRRGEGMPRRVEAGGPSTLVAIRGTEQGTERVTIDAEKWVGEPQPDGALTATAGPGFSGERISAAEDQTWTLEGRWLEIDRDGQGRIRRVEGREEVALELSEAIRMSSDTLTWSAAKADRVLLDGEPARAWQGMDVIEAPRLVLLRDERELVAEGGATAELQSLRGTGLFGAQEPVRIRSERVFVPETERPVLFDGRAQAWQGTSMLRAGLIRVERTGAWLVAENDVVLRLGRAEDSGLEQASRLMADRLEYLAGERMARLRGETSYSAGERRIRAERMDMSVGEDGELESLVAEGEVGLAVEGASGRGDRLEWTGGATGRILLIGRASPAQLTAAGPDGTPRVLDAPRIGYDLETGSVTTQAGAGRSRVRTAPEDAPEQDGQQGGQQDEEEER
jgi:lipopolysaccharide export system protein LptA